MGVLSTPPDKRERLIFYYYKVKNFWWGCCALRLFLSTARKRAVGRRKRIADRLDSTYPNSASRLRRCATLKTLLAVSRLPSVILAGRDG